MHTGHSAVIASDAPSAPPAVNMGVERRRAMPPSFTEEARCSFREIAARAQNEAVYTYAILCLGAQAYLTATHLCNSEHADPPATAADGGGAASQ